MERSARHPMNRVNPIVAVGDPRLKEHIKLAIGNSSEFPLLPNFLPLTSRRGLRNFGRRMVVLGSKELSRYRSKNPARLKLLKRHACIIVLLQNYDAGKILEAVSCADGLIFHDANPDRMRLIAELASSGYLAIPPAMSAMMINRNLRHELLQTLSPAENRVLGLLGRGSSNRIIGETLALDEGRTKYLIRSVFKKLHLQNRTQAAVFARDVLFSTSMTPHQTIGETTTH